MSIHEPHQADPRRASPVSLVLAALLTGTLLATLPPAASAQAVTRDVARASLAQQWEQVAELLCHVDKKAPSPVPRMIMGHACLALNRNNESLELFASALNDADRRAWKAWADDFAQSHSRSAIAWYFKGDALARQEDWKAALECFKEALRRDPRCYLAGNARGVVYHALGDTESARSDFVVSTKVKPDFADAYASRGTLNVYQYNTGAAEAAFQKATRYSKDDGALLVVNGIGCTYYGEEKYLEARKCFDAVPETSELSPLARRNALVIELEELAGALKEASDVKMSITAVTSAVAEGGVSGPDLQRRIEQVERMQMSASTWREWLLIGYNVFVIYTTPIVVEEPPEPAGPTAGEEEPGGEDKPGQGQGPSDGGNNGDKGKDKDKGKGGSKGGDKPKPKPPEPAGPTGGEDEPVDKGKHERQIAPPLLPPLPPDIGLPGLGGFPSPGGGFPGPGGFPPGPGGGDFPSPGGFPPGPGGLPPIFPGDFAAATEAIERITAAVNREIAAAPATKSRRKGFRGNQPIDGIDGDVSALRTNRGKWSVCSVYGLLYAVPLQSSQDQPRSMTKPDN